MAIELNDRDTQNQERVTRNSTDLELYQLLSDMKSAAHAEQASHERDRETTEPRTNGRRLPPSKELLQFGIINGFSSFTNARRSAGMRNYWAKIKNSNICFSAGSVNTDIISSERPHFVAARRPMR